MFSQVNAAADVQSNGTFSFFGSETGVDFADFLIGVPSFYKQGDAQPFYMRNHYGALFVQDSWRIRPRLTLNYGARWDVIMPWYEKYNQIQTLVPGEQSVVYPGAPDGIGFSRRSGRIARSRVGALERFVAAAWAGVGSAGRQRFGADAVRRYGQDQHPAGIRTVLLSHRRRFGRRDGGRPALRQHLLESRSAAVCRSVHHRFHGL